MTPLDWTIDEDIRRASTLPAEVYGDPRRRTTCRRSRSAPGGSSSSPRSIPPSRWRSWRRRWTPGSPGCPSARPCSTPVREQGVHHFHRLLERFLGW